MELNYHLPEEYGYPDWKWMTMGIRIARGHSGSPVLNTSGEIVSVVQIGPPESWEADMIYAAQAGGAPWEELDKLRKWWGKK